MKAMVRVALLLAVGFVVTANVSAKCELLYMMTYQSTVCCKGGPRGGCDSCIARYEYYHCGNGAITVEVVCCRL